MTTTSRHSVRLLLVLAALSLAQCGTNYRKDGARLGPHAPRAILAVQWAKQLVPDEFLYYGRQEWATAAIGPDGTFYVGSSTGRFAAYDGRGRRRWANQLIGAISSEPLYDHFTRTVFVGADDGGMYAIDATTGKTQWRYATKGTVVKQPVLSEGLLLFTTSEDRIYALSAKDGAWRWQFDREKPEGFTIHGHSGAAVARGVAYCGFADGSLVALKVANGEAIWLRQLSGGKKRFIDVDATPQVIGDRVYTAGYASGIYALSTRDGSTVWHRPMVGVTAVTASSKRVFAVAPRTGIVALDRTGREVWRQAIADGIPAQPVVHSDLVFITGTETGLFVASQQDGRLLQYFHTGGGTSGPAAVGQGQVAILTNRGRFYALRLL